MTKILKFPALVCAMLLATVFTACNDETKQNPLDTVYMDMMTFVSTGDDGSVFTMQQTIDKPVITYTCAQKYTGNAFKPGDRMVVMYKLGTLRDPYTSGPINVLSAAPAINGTLSWATAAEADNFGSNTLQMQSLWVTENYLNMDFIAVLQNEPKKLTLVADEATRDEKMPTVYLIFESDRNGAGTWKRVFASLNISEIWSNSKYDGFILRVPEEANPSLESIEFKKSETIKPVE